MNMQVFKPNDVRGVYPVELDESFAYGLGRAIATVWPGKIVVGGDGRISTPALRKSLINGLVDSGAEVIDLRLTPTPMVCFAVRHLEADLGINITASHNPPEYNGFKFLDSKGRAFNTFDELKKTLDSSNFKNNCGNLEEIDLKKEYVDYLTSKIKTKLNFKIVADFGNAVPGIIFPAVFEKVGLKVIPLFAELDGDFPNHLPNPESEKYLQDVMAKVKEEKADFGVSFDGDGDRVAVINSNGEIIPSELSFAALIHSKKGKYVQDSLISRKIRDFVNERGSELTICRVGHTFVIQKMKETDSDIGGELSGHFYFKEIEYVDDACFATLKILEAITKISLKDLATRLPKYYSNISRDNRITFHGDKEAYIEKLAKQFKDQGFETDRLDGVRILMPRGGWLLVRASNTEPVLIYSYESSDKAEFEELKTIMDNILVEVKNAGN